MRREPQSFCYIRQSKNRTDQKYSYDYQYDECYQAWQAQQAKQSFPPWAGRNEVFFDEDVSGRSVKFEDRPEAKRLLRRLSAGDHLFIWRIDRLGRRIFDIVPTVARLIDVCRVRVNVANMQGQHMDLSSTLGKCILMGLSIAAEIEGEAISERCKASAAFLRRAGLPVNGWPPSGYGWKWEMHGYDERGKELKVEVPDLEQREIMHQIWMMKKAGVSERKIVKRLNKAGKYARNNKPWTLCKLQRVHGWLARKFAARFDDPGPENWPEQARRLIDPELQHDPLPMLDPEQPVLIGQPRNPKTKDWYQDESGRWKLKPRNR